MSDSVAYLDYTIWLTDPVQVAALQAGNPEGRAARTGVPDADPITGYVIMAPALAATTYAAPLLLPPAPFAAPCCTSPWFGLGNSANYPVDQRTFDRDSGGWFGWHFLFGDTVTYYWRGVFKLAPTVAGGTPVPGETAVPMALRRWIDGAELPDGGEGGSGNGAPQIARKASRHLGGYGYNFDSSTLQRTHNTTEATGGAAGLTQWERFYLRVRRFHTTSVKVWQHHQSINGGAAADISLTPNGILTVSAWDISGAVVIASATAPLAVNRWYKLDIQFGVNASAGLDLWVNGAKVLAAAFASSSYMANVTCALADSTIGHGAANTAIYEIDDWIAAAKPTFGVAAFPGLDWNNGSRVVPVAATAFAADHDALWIGDWRILKQRPASNNPTTPVVLATSTALARLSIVTDAAISIDGPVTSLGIAALTIGLHSIRGNTSGTLGYKFPGGADVLAAVTQSTFMGWNTGTQILYRGGTTYPLRPLAGLEIKHVKGNDAVASNVEVLMAAAELIGTFGPEDVVVQPAQPVTETTAPHTGQHNAPYPNSPWAREGAPPVSPVNIVSGTYVGNGTFTDLEFRIPPHWVWIHPATNNGGTLWWSSQNGSHQTLRRQGFPALAGEVFEATKVPPPAVENDQEKAYFIRLLGADVNTNAVTYQYVALCDPGMRYLLAGGLNASVGAGTLVTALELESFTPECVFLQQEMNTDATNGGHYKGPGHATDAVSPLTAAEIATGLAMGLGTLTYKAGLTFAAQQLAFIAFRRDDGAPLDDPGDVGVPSIFADSLVDDTAHAGSSPANDLYWAAKVDRVATYQGNPVGPDDHAYWVPLLEADPTNWPYWRDEKMLAGFQATAGGRMVQLTKYTGDGSASRTINLTPATGRRPLFAMVVPHNAASVVRGPDHTGTTSMTLPSTANAATGITAGGLDSLSVGSALNANGIVYDVFVIPGGSVACNGGFSCNGEFPPGRPKTPTGWPGNPNPVPVPPTIVPPVTPPVEPGGGNPTNPNFALVCGEETTRVINQALTRIGVNKFIAAIATDATEAAAVARLCYAADVDAVLRDFPWPFATKYFTGLLVITGPTPPANADWIYALRQPADCVFERRLVKARAGAVDPGSPPFELGEDSLGGIIYTNEPPGAVLEYTARPSCAALRGDPLFREALIWKLAGSLAPSLSRMTDVVAFCGKNYEAQIAKAWRVMRPGKPGTVPAAPTIDITAPHQLVNLQTVNRALIRIGAQTIPELLTDQSREAQAVRAVFEDELQSTLRDFPWSFATEYLTPALVAGTSSVPVNEDWQYSYRLPADVVFVRRIVEVGNKRVYAPHPATFKLATDATGKLLYTNVATVTVEVTQRVTGCLANGDAVFRDAFAWRLAATLAPSLAQTNPTKVEQEGRGPEETPKDPSRITVQLRSAVTRWAWAMYRDALILARQTDAREQQQEPPGEAEWITGRN